jgi:hypothetical protein
VQYGPAARAAQGAQAKDEVVSLQHDALTTTALAHTHIPRKFQKTHLVKTAQFSLLRGFFTLRASILQILSQGRSS